MNKQEFIANAKELLDRGFNVIPLFGHNDLGVEESKRGKAPRINWLPYQHIKSTMKEIENWSCLSNEMNLGIVCGKTSNIIVVDADNETAINTLDELILPETLTVRPAKGKHLYFKYFESDVINNAVRFYDGIDIRTQGGFVVAPGSLHRLGTTYEFVNNSPIIEMPENLIAFIKDNIEKKSKKSAEKGAKLVETLKEGNRNDTLFRVACSMRAIGIDENIIKYAIEKQNNMLSSPLEENELSTLLSSVFRYESGRQIRGLTDYDNGLRMKDLYENVLCFIPERKKWASYNGNRWVLDDTRGIAVEKFIGMADAIVTEVPEPKNEEETNAYEERVKLSKSCRNLQRINNGLI